MRFERVKVIRDTNTVHSKFVVPWEIPVLEFVFDEGNVERTDEYIENGAEYPSAASEYDRLTRCYGKDPQSGVAYVASVYGNAGAGVRALAKAMKDAQAEAVADPAPKLQMTSTSHRQGAVVEDALLS